MPLQISRLSSSDLPSAIRSQYRAFAREQMHEALFGADSPEMHEATHTRLLKEIRTDPSTCWMKVVDSESGEMMCCGNWKIWAGYAPTGASATASGEKDEQQNGVGAEQKDVHDFKAAKGGFEMECTWWTGSEKVQAEAITRDFMQRRARHVREPCVLLHILFTDPAHQNRGAGSKMIEWGTTLADHLQLPAWVEASEVAAPLYRKHGFVDVEHCVMKTERWEARYWVMRRGLGGRPVDGALDS